MANKVLILVALVASIAIESCLANRYENYVPGSSASASASASSAAVATASGHQGAHHHYQPHHVQRHHSGHSCDNAHCMDDTTNWGNPTGTRVRPKFVSKIPAIGRLAYNGYQRQLHGNLKQERQLAKDAKASLSYAKKAAPRSGLRRIKTDEVIFQKDHLNYHKNNARTIKQMIRDKIPPPVVEHNHY